VGPAFTYLESVSSKEEINTFHKENLFKKISQDDVIAKRSQCLGNIYATFDDEEDHLGNISQYTTSTVLSSHVTKRRQM
jgi:hypothetical protein